MATVHWIDLYLFLWVRNFPVECLFLWQINDRWELRYRIVLFTASWSLIFSNWDRDQGPVRTLLFRQLIVAFWCLWTLSLDQALHFDVGGQLLVDDAFRWRFLILDVLLFVHILLIWTLLQALAWTLLFVHYVLFAYDIVIFVYTFVAKVYQSWLFHASWNLPVWGNSLECAVSVTCSLPLSSWSEQVSLLVRTLDDLWRHTSWQIFRLPSAEILQFPIGTLYLDLNWVIHFRSLLWVLMAASRLCEKVVWVTFTQRL